MMTRRQIISSLAAAPAALSQPGKPNFLVLHTDDQRFDTIRALGNRQISTPNMDRLAARGVTFTQAATQGGLTGAICMPSRAQLMTGMNVFRVHKSIVDHPAKPDPNVITFPERLRQAGYRTFHSGKWHIGPPLHHRSFTHGANVFFGGMSDHLKMPVFDFDPAGRYPKEKSRAADGFSSQVIANSAIEFLKSQQDRGPFLLYAAFTSPHDPRMAPRRFADMYDPAKIELPRNFMPHHPFDNGELKVRDELLAPFPRTEDEVRRHIAAYYAMISEVDNEIGRILDVLDASGHASNTYVVFVGDNGLAVGRHGLLGKQNLYDHSLRVPLIVAGPGITKGGRDDSLCHIMDIAPTICNWAGAPLPGPLDARDLFKSKPRGSAFAAYRGFQRSLRNKDWKLILYNVNGTRTTQLFDLKNDPDELRNLADSPAQRSRLNRMKAELQSELKVSGDESDWTTGFDVSR
jgi:arylsulfatase A-like enzyme